MAEIAVGPDQGPGPEFCNPDMPVMPVDLDLWFKLAQTSISTLSRQGFAIEFRRAPSIEFGRGKRARVRQGADKLDWEIQISHLIKAERRKYASSNEIHFLMPDLDSS